MSTLDSNLFTGWRRTEDL